MKVNKELAREIDQVRQLFLQSNTPWVPIPMPKKFRKAARYLEREGFLTSEDALRRPGSPNVVKGYMRPTRPDKPVTE